MFATFVKICYNEIRLQKSLVFQALSAICSLSHIIKTQQNPNNLENPWVFPGAFLFLSLLSFYPSILSILIWSFWSSALFRYDTKLYATIQNDIVEFSVTNTVVISWSPCRKVWSFLVTALCLCPVYIVMGWLLHHLSYPNIGID